MFGTVLPLEGDLPVAVSTLGVAALFNPLRQRAQTLVDRRFHRTRVDSERIVDDLSRRLQDQADLAELSQGLGEAVMDSLQPGTVSVWLRPEDPRRDPTPL